MIFEKSEEEEVCITGGRDSLTPGVRPGWQQIKENHKGPQDVRKNCKISHRGEKKINSKC